MAVQEHAVRVEDLNPSADQAEVAFFRCRQCGAEPMFLIKDDISEPYHCRAEDSLGLDRHADLAPLG